MLMTPPPGYSPSPMNRQTTQRLGTPGLQSAPALGMRPGGFTAAPSAVSANPLGQQQNTAALLKLLRGGM
jgi:hypothetical protein